MITTLGVIVLGVLMFMFLVVIHELGHYLAAKKSGVFVKEFGVGIPPKALSLGKDKQGTEWTLNRIPLGGFVRLQGDDPSDDNEFLHPQSFINASLGKKIIILLGGVIVNALFALLAFIVSFWIGVKPIVILPENATREVSESYLIASQSYLEDQGLLVIDESVKDATVMIETIDPEGVGAQAGIQEGDEIIALNGQPVFVSNLSETLQSLAGETFQVDLARAGQRLQLQVTCPAGRCLLGVVVPMGNIQVPTLQFDGRDGVKAGLHEMAAQTSLTFSSLGKLGGSLLSFDKERIGDSVDGLSGPVGIVKIGGDILTSGGRVLYLAFAGMISLALAIFNILPIPALDGGRIVGAITQAVGKFSPHSYFIIENYINFFFFVVLMILGVYIMFKDLVQVRNVSIPFIG